MTSKQTSHAIFVKQKLLYHFKQRALAQSDQAAYKTQKITFVILSEWNERPNGLQGVTAVKKLNFEHSKNPYFFNPLKQPLKPRFFALA